MGIDIHNKIADQQEHGQCLACSHEVTTKKDWYKFKRLMKKHFNVNISDEHMPNRLKTIEEADKIIKLGLTEAKKPEPVNVEALKKGFIEVSRKLSKQHGLKWERTWINELKGMLEKQKISHGNSDPEEPFDLSDYVIHYANIVYYHHSSTFMISNEIDAMIEEYQDRMAKNPDDPWDYIESSDYLTSMHAQKDCAKALSLFHPDQLLEYKSILKQLELFADYWIVDQNYEPVLCEKMYQGLCEFIPFVLFILQFDAF
jgi:hypothetical protein